MSKNVKVNGKEYAGVSQIQLPTTAGGTSLFKDVDEITTPSGSVTITENGTHDVTNYAKAVVNVVAGGEAETYLDELSAVLSGGEVNLVLPESVTVLKNSAFREHSGLLSIQMPGVKTLGSWCFAYCTKLTLTELPNGLESIGDQAFQYASKVTINTIPASVKTIGKSAFAMSGSKGTLTFLGTPESIASDALGAFDTVNVPWAEGAVANAPWGADTVNYNYTGE